MRLWLVSVGVKVNLTVSGSIRIRDRVSVHVWANSSCDTKWYKSIPGERGPWG
jgi:predicted SPOUT superfamily RNA methylase MTH1